MVTMSLILFLFFKKFISSILPDEKVHIHDLTFNEVVQIYGNEFDGVLIENCIFENHADIGLRIQDVENVTVRSCTFRNLGGNGIQMKNLVYSKHVRIEKCLFENIGKNGILGGELHQFTTIIGNTIRNIGLDSSYCIPAPCHGIYWQGTGFVIQENKIHSTSTANGNSVSVRTYGSVISNLLYNTTKNGISYYSDHPGYGGHLLMEYNTIYDVEVRGAHCSQSDPVNDIGSADFGNNIIVANNDRCISVNTDLDVLSVDVYHNLVNGDRNIVLPSSMADKELWGNMEDFSFGNFVDYTNRNLRLKFDIMSTTTEY